LKTRPFSMERYREILQLALDQHYWFPTVSEVGRPPLTARRFLLIRHDIDVSVDAALEMATVEREFGIKTSYYVRLHCPYYNILEQETLKKILMIRDMGHEIGLHYEALFFKALGFNVVTGIFRDIRILEDILSAKIKSISQHNPSLSDVYPELWGKYIDAYSPLLVKDVKYFGDSGRRWREGCISEKIGKYEQIHVLIHAYSWTKWNENWEDNFRAHGDAAIAKIKREVEENVRLLRNYLAHREDLDKKRDAKYAANLSKAPMATEMDPKIPTSS
jgi:hypothetical protein